MSPWNRSLLALACAVAIAAGAAAPAASQPRRRADPAPPPAAPPPPDIRVRSELSQTAAWVGDPLEFLVELDLAPGVEVVAADLKPEQLVVEGLEIGEVTVSEQARTDGWRTLQHRYRVTPWDPTARARIGDLVVRFRRPVTTATADRSAPAAEITVPGAVVAVRSTLPDDGRAGGARDRQAALAVPAWLAWLRPIGIGLLIVGAAPVLLWVAARAHRPRQARPRRSSRSLHARVKALLDELQHIDTSTPEGRRRAYDRIDHDVRAFLVHAEAVPAAALTAEELRVRLAASRQVQGDVLCDVLAACEHARYGPEDRLPGPDEVGNLVARLRQTLGR